MDLTEDKPDEPGDVGPTQMGEDVEKTEEAAAEATKGWAWVQS